MIHRAKNLIETTLKYIGVKQIFRDEDAFDRVRASPSAIILTAREKLEPDRKKAAKFEQGGRRYLRSKRFKRIIPIEVSIFDRDEEKVDSWIQLLLNELPDGIDDGKGNYTPLRPSAIEWIPDQKDRAAATVFIEFESGIFRDQELDTIEQVIITTEVNRP
ncbi:hypothetical protein [Paenibacillus tyrfis]|uniref:Uncharacterized protein n=1 Tax=Paenibacillus tyrfis TaxID=1501230 RepID=A0A081NYA1_9BACL|nr:hypothetical protein [Paenibacillus tyrfis]KEQ23424.1 hypothetical protein ET33_16485 [Paenibacillus tyrfis]